MTDLPILKRKKIESFISDLLIPDEGAEEDIMKKQLAQALLSRVNDSDSPTKRSKYFTPNKSFILLFDCMNLNTDKPHLDIPVNRCLPHFTFHIGPKEGTFHPQLQPAYDTCAALNCGFLNYHIAIAKSYPELVKSLTWAGDHYSPIILKGVVAEGEGRDHTTALTAVIEYFTPYTTGDGSATTLKVALGPDVSANLILDLSTIKNAKLVFDPDDDVISSSVLENFSPSTVIYKNTNRCLPNNLAKTADSSNLTLHCQAIIHNATIIEDAVKNDKKSSLIHPTADVKVEIESEPTPDNNSPELISSNSKIKKSVNFDSFTGVTNIPYL